MTSPTFASSPLPPTVMAQSPASLTRRLRNLAVDTATMIARSLRLASRDPDALILAVVLPVVLMVLFVYVFGGAMSVGTSYVQYATPGIILLCAGYGAALTAVNVQQDMHSGIIDRLRSLPMASSAVLTGHVITSVAKNLVSTAIVFGVAFLVGFRPSASLSAWFGAVGVIVLFILAITWMSTLVGVVARTPDAASGFTFFMLFLPYVSSAFVPPETMPSWLRGFAEHQPVTPIIETIRGLLTGTPLGNAPALAVAWTLSMTVVFLAASALAFARQRQR